MHQDLTTPDYWDQHHAARPTAAGGLAITAPNYATARAPRVLLEQLAPHAFRTHNLAMMAPAALRHVLEAAGLKEVRAGSGTGAQFYTGGMASGAAARAYRLGG